MTTGKGRYPLISGQTNKKMRAEKPAFSLQHNGHSPARLELNLSPDLLLVMVQTQRVLARRRQVTQRPNAIRIGDRGHVGNADRPGGNHDNDAFQRVPQTVGDGDHVRVGWVDCHR